MRKYDCDTWNGQCTYDCLCGTVTLGTVATVTNKEHGTVISQVKMQENIKKGIVGE